MFVNKHLPYTLRCSRSSDREKTWARAVKSTRGMHISFSSRVPARARLAALARRSNSLAITRALNTQADKTAVILKWAKISWNAFFYLCHSSPRRHHLEWFGERNLGIAAFIFSFSPNSRVYLTKQILFSLQVTYPFDYMLTFTTVTLRLTCRTPRILYHDS